MPMATQRLVSGLIPAKLHEIMAEKNRNHLQLCIRKEDKATRLKFIKEDTFVICLMKSERSFLRESCRARVYVSVHTCQHQHATHPPDINNMSNNSPSGQSQHPLALHCTSAFLAHYGFTDDEIFAVKHMAFPELDKVVLEAKSERAFNWANSHFFSTSLLLNVCKQQKVLMKRGEIFNQPHCDIFEDDPLFDAGIGSELYVVDTEPFLQGLVSHGTQFVVVKAPDNDTVLSVSSTDTNASQKSVPTENKKPVLILDKSNKAQIVVTRDWYSLPCCAFGESASLVNPSIEHDYGMFMTLPTAQTYHLPDKSLLEIQLEQKDENVQDNSDCKNNTNEGGNQNGGDKNTTADEGGNQNGGDKNTTADEGGNQNGGDLTLNSSRLNCENGTRVTRLKILPKTAHYKYERDEVYLSASVMYNINKHHQISSNEADGCELFLKFRKYESCVDFVSSRLSSESDQVVWGLEVYISCVFSPNYSAGSSYATSLQAYFNTPRMMKVDDIFAVDISADLELMKSATSSKKPPLVYFKVKKIVSTSDKFDETFMVDTDHSTLYQEDACHSFVPSLSMRRSPLTGWPVEPGHEQCTDDAQVFPPALGKYAQEISQLLQPYVRDWHSSLESAPPVLLCGLSGSGKSAIARGVAHILHMHFIEVNCYDLCGDTSSTTEARIQQCRQKSVMFAPCILLLRNIHALGKDQDASTEDPRVAGYLQQSLLNLSHEDSRDWPVITMATTLASTMITPDVHSAFLYTKEVQVLDEMERLSTLTALMNDDVPCSTTLSVKALAHRTAGFVYDDLRILLSQAKKIAISRILETSSGVSSKDEQQVWDLCQCGPLLQKHDFDKALDHAQSSHADAIGAPKIPSVKWEDVGGLSAVKADILDTIQLPLTHPQLFKTGLRRSGVLLYGPPGTGKTLLAKAVATECSLNFLSVKGPELINMYVGQSEENVREVFARARNAAPCVIFFDELDSLAPSRGRSGDSGGVMDRVVSQLLAELDGMHKSMDVFVIGATNRPDLLDPALLRPGRFDKLLYLGVSEDQQQQLKILQALTRKFTLGKGCDLMNVVKRCPKQLTGADLYALCSEAQMNSVKRSIEHLDSGALTLGPEEDGDHLAVLEEDFHTSLDKLVPSVSADELQYYKSLQQGLSAQKLIPGQ